MCSNLRAYLQLNSFYKTAKLHKMLGDKSDKSVDLLLLVQERFLGRYIKLNSDVSDTIVFACRSKLSISTTESESILVRRKRVSDRSAMQAVRGHETVRSDVIRSCAADIVRESYVFQFPQ